MGEPVHVDPARYEKLYADQQVAHGLPAATPRDIGGPQPVVQQLVALGAIKLEGLQSRFDTVVDCAFYHVFSDVPEATRTYARALHRATKPGARLCMFEFGVGNVNGYGAPRSLSMEDFLLVFPEAGWQITYFWPTTYEVNMSLEAFDHMIARNPEKPEQIKPVAERFRLFQSWLTNGRAHAPFWEMHATRLD